MVCKNSFQKLLTLPIEIVDLICDRVVSPLAHSTDVELSVTNEQAMVWRRVTSRCIFQDYTFVPSEIRAVEPRSCENS